MDEKKEDVASNSSAGKDGSVPSTSQGEPPSPSENASLNTGDKEELETNKNKEENDGGNKKPAQSLLNKMDEDQLSLISKQDDTSEYSKADGDVTYIDPDEYIEKVGQCGLYQIRTQIIFMFFMIPIASQILIMYFVGHNPPWRCKEGSKTCKFNGTVGTFDHHFFARCKMERSEWEYTTSKEYSIVTQFDLVCARGGLALIANSVIFIGWSIGGLTLPYAADLVGRKWTFFPTTFVIFLSVIVSAAIENMPVFIICRFLVGFCLGGCHVSIFVLASEITGPAYRAISGTMVWVFFTGGLLLVTLEAYLLQNWKLLQLVSVVPYIFVFFLWSCVPESIRWYVAKGKTELAENLLKKIAIVNRKPEPTDKLREEKEIQSSENFLALFYPCPLLTNSLILVFGWFTCGVTYYTVSLASEDLSGDLYRDFALVSVMGLPANVVVVTCCDKIGRKKTTIAHFFIAAVAVFGIALVPLEGSHAAAKAARVALGMTGRYACTVAFNSLFIWSAELHATVIRTQACGFFIVTSRIGASLAPLIAYELKFVHPALPFVLMGGLNVVAAISAFKLNETVGKPLVETMQEMLKNLGVDPEPEDELPKQ